MFDGVVPTSLERPQACDLSMLLVTEEATTA